MSELNVLLTKQQSLSQIIVRFLKNYSFFIIAILLFIIEAINILKGNWQSDFWEHSAVVKELSEDLWSPSNPFFRSDIPHPFFSPYAVFVAAFARITHLNSIQALGWMAFFNLIFFLFSFYKFCLSLFKEKASIVGTIGLIFMLFFWGKGPFGWSGFYHFMALHQVLPYPSTFAIALTFFILSILIKDQHASYLNQKTIGIVLLNTIVLLVHPNTALFLFTVIISLNFCFSNYSIKYTIIRSIVLILPAILLSFLWPYFSMIDLLFGNNEDFQLASKKLYRGGVRVNWPFLLLIPGIFLIKKDKIISFFLLSLSLMIGIFFLGYLIRVYTVSRLISGIMMFAQLLMAYFIVISFFQKNKMLNKAYVCFIIACFSVTLFINRKLINDSLHIPYGHFYKDYNFLRQLVNTDDVVLSDRGSSSGIPSFNGKVISNDKPVYWISDIKERREAMRTFFTKENPDSIRKIVIDKYKPDYILLDHSRLDLQPLTIQWIRSLGEAVYKKDQKELIHLKR